MSLWAKNSLGELFLTRGGHYTGLGLYSPDSRTATQTDVIGMYPKFKPIHCEVLLWSIDEDTQNCHMSVCSDISFEYCCY